MANHILIFQDISTSISAQGDPPVASPSQRFVAVLDGAAVKDLQTGFTWEQSPDVFYGVWTDAIAHCRGKTVGGRTAWRLPSIKELSTLIDSSQKDPAFRPAIPLATLNLRSTGRLHLQRPKISLPGMSVFSPVKS